MIRVESLKGHHVAHSEEVEGWVEGHVRRHGEVGEVVGKALALYRWSVLVGLLCITVWVGCELGEEGGQKVLLVVILLSDGLHGWSSSWTLSGMKKLISELTLSSQSLAITCSVGPVFRRRRGFLCPLSSARRPTRLAPMQTQAQSKPARIHAYHNQKRNLLGPRAAQVPPAWRDQKPKDQGSKILLSRLPADVGETEVEVRTGAAMHGIIYKVASS